MHIVELFRQKRGHMPPLKRLRKNYHPDYPFKINSLQIRLQVCCLSSHSIKQLK